MFLAGIVPAGATIRTWVKSSGTNDWFDKSNWDPNDNYPQAGDEVAITNAGVGAAVLLTNSTEYLGSLTLSKTLIFSNWNSTLSAAIVTMKTNGVMTLPSAFTNDQMSNNVRVICSNIIIDAGAKIDADGRGYAGGANYKNGFGPGCGLNSGNYGSGGAYGGNGGQFSFGLGGIAYGSMTQPLQPGSGGSGGLWGPGTAAGGTIVLLVTNQLVCNGILSACGLNTASSYAGAGSGGGVYIQCATLSASNGVIRAWGGSATESTGTGSGGGGGRIALDYGALTLPASLSLRAEGGFSLLKPGDLGTINLPDNRLLVETNNQWQCGELHGITNWSPNSLLLSNACLRFPADGYNLHVRGNLIIAGTNAQLQMGGEQIITLVMPVHCGATLPPILTVDGNLSLTNGGSMILYSAATSDVTNEYGCLLNVKALLSIGSNSWLGLVSHPINGGSPKILTGSMTIETNGAIHCPYNGGTKNPAPAGYAWGYVTNNLGNIAWPYTMTNHADGFGLGGGANKEGGSYGGRGGAALGGLAALGKVYGSSNYPAYPGSGGSGSYTCGGFGGGLARIEASGNIVVNGEINMNGYSASGVYSAGGAGGGINIRCRRFAGAGLLSVRGGDASSNAGGGGGGRIAVWSIDNTFRDVGSTVIIGGAGANGYGSGEAGTLVWGYLPPPGTVFVIR